MNMSKLIIAMFVSVVVSACESEPDSDLLDSIVETTPTTNGDVNPTALFDPSNSVIPFPNNLLFSGSLDGTINIPVADTTDLADPQVALNSLDGFSTVAPMSSGFSTAIDDSSITPASVKMYEVTLSGLGGAVIAIKEQLTFGIDYVAVLSSVDTSQSTLAILPLTPLDEKTSYMVVITDELMTSSSEAFDPSITYRLIKNLPDPLTLTAGDPSLPGALQSLDLDDLTSFESLRQLVNVGEGTVAAFDSDIETSDIILSWSFTTQSVGDVLKVVRSMAGTPAASLSASTVVLGAAGAGKSPAGAANMFEGTIDVPYYLTVPSQANPVANLTVPWQAANVVGEERNLTNLNPLPASTATVTIPMLVSTPVDTATFPAPWKTVIFQHGITQARTDLLAVADTMASVGFAVVAIDMPLHGVDDSSPYYQQGKERTFDVDFVTQDGETITAAGPDGVVDTTGAHYANLQNLVVLRDNLRQAVADLFALTAAIPELDIGDAGEGDFDGSNIYYVGHSFGSIMGTTFLALEENVKDAVLGMSGVGLAKIMDGSTVFSPQLVNGLALAGVSKGSADYETFLGAAQTVIDSVDSVNYADEAADDRGILLFEVIGGNTSPSDLFVPNKVPDDNDVSTGTGPTVPAPLSGTDAMIKLMDLEQINTSQTPDSDLKIVVKFTAGDHRSFLSDDSALLDDPDFASAEVTANIRTGMASFLATGGTGITIVDDSVIEVPAED